MCKAYQLRIALVFLGLHEAVQRGEEGGIERENLLNEKSVGLAGARGRVQFIQALGLLLQTAELSEEGIELLELAGLRTGAELLDEAR